MHRLIIAVAVLATFFLAASISAAEKATLILEHDQPSAWTDLLRAGLASGGKDFGVDTEIVIAPVNSDQTSVFRKACETSSLVIVASDNLHEILRDNAANFRRVKFGAIDAGIRASNIMSVTFADEQAAFLAGASAAILAGEKANAGQNSSGTIGWLSGADTPAMRSLFNGFVEGAKLADPQIRVIQAIVGTFTNPQAAAQKAEALLNSGATVVALASGSGNDAARKVINSRNAWFIDLDRPSGSAGNLLGVIVKNADKAVYEIMASAFSPKFRGKEIVVYDLANNGVKMQPANNLTKAPAGKEIIRRINELEHELRRGSIKLHSLRARTLCDCLD